MERGKGVDRLIPVEFEYKADTNKLMDRAISFLYAATTIAIFYYIFKQVKNVGGAMGKGGGGSDIFGIGQNIFLFSLGFSLFEYNFSFFVQKKSDFS